VSTVYSQGINKLREADTTMQPRDWSQYPPYLFADYKSTRLRGPTRELVRLQSFYEGGAVAGEQLGKLTHKFTADAIDHDLTKNARHDGEPIGERIVVSGRILDDRGRPIPGALIEIWQANSCGRYFHKIDQHEAPLDPNFLGAGAAISDRDGRYRFYTIKPGAYPWRNHDNAWRPQHLHFSVTGHNVATRLVTQMYFPGDPLLELDPVFLAVPAMARQGLIAHLDLSVTEPEFALGYHFDIILRRVDPVIAK